MDKWEKRLIEEWEERERHYADNPGAVRCLCGGKMILNRYEAFSSDSSFSYVGCSRCDLAFTGEDDVTVEVVERWNRHNRSETI